MRMDRLRIGDPLSMGCQMYWIGTAAPSPQMVPPCEVFVWGVASLGLGFVKLVSSVCVGRSGGNLFPFALTFAVLCVSS